MRLRWRASVRLTPEREHLWTQPPTLALDTNDLAHIHTAKISVLNLCMSRHELHGVCRVLNQAGAIT